jgi:hypothetical protein
MSGTVLGSSQPSYIHKITWMEVLADRIWTVFCRASPKWGGPSKCPCMLFFYTQRATRTSLFLNLHTLPTTRSFHFKDLTEEDVMNNWQEISVVHAAAYQACLPEQFYTAVI